MAKKHNEAFFPGLPRADARFKNSEFDQRYNVFTVETDVQPRFAVTHFTQEQGPNVFFQSAATVPTHRQRTIALISRAGSQLCANCFLNLTSAKRQRYPFYVCASWGTVNCQPGEIATAMLTGTGCSSKQDPTDDGLLIKSKGQGQPSLPDRGS